MGCLLSNLTEKRQRGCDGSRCGPAGGGGGRAARRPRRPVGGGEASREGEGGGEEVADAGEVVTAGGSDGEAGVAARA